METATLTRTWTLRLPRERSLELGGRPRVMGILNLTPDSFSDGGLWLDPPRAVERGLRMLAEGDEILDLGAESTRPGGGVHGEGAQTVPPEEEAGRRLPVLEALRAATAAPRSVGSRKSFIAKAAARPGLPEATPERRLGGSLAAVAWAASRGAAIVRVHDVAETAQFLDVWHAIARQGAGS